MWEIKLTPEAQKDFDGLDGSVKKPVAKAIQKVSQNPLPATEGGYGKPLGSKGGTNLTGLLKIKLKKFGIRIVYKLVKNEETGTMEIIVISLRSENQVYEIAAAREGRK